MNALLDSSKCRFTKERLEDLYGAVDDEVLERVAARNKMHLFKDDEDEEIEDEIVEEEFFDEPVASAPKIETGIRTKSWTSHTMHPRCCLYSIGLSPPKDSLIRLRLYQLI